MNAGRGGADVNIQTSNLQRIARDGHRAMPYGRGLDRAAAMAAARLSVRQLLQPGEANNRDHEQRAPMTWSIKVKAARTAAQRKASASMVTMCASSPASDGLAPTGWSARRRVPWHRRRYICAPPAWSTPSAGPVAAFLSQRADRAAEQVQGNLNQQHQPSSRTRGRRTASRRRKAADHHTSASWRDRQRSPASSAITYRSTAGRTPAATATSGRSAASLQISMHSLGTSPLWPPSVQAGTADARRMQFAAVREILAATSRSPLAARGLK